MVPSDRRKQLGNQGVSDLVFRWATSLRIRQDERDRLRLQLTEDTDLWQQTTRHLAYRRGTRREVTDRLQGLRLAGRVDLYALRLQHLYRDAIDRQIRLLEQQTGRQRKQVEDCRGALVDAERAVQAIEKLCLREALRHRQRQQDSETEQLDEAATTTWLRRQTAGET